MKYGWEGAIKTRCPYYLGESKYSIRCECREADACQVYKFLTQEAKRDFQRRWCYLESGWCSHARRMEEYYAEKLNGTQGNKA